ncbi:MAG: V-type ATPase subunit, partial [Methermicoccaceae archaeon]
TTYTDIPSTPTDGQQVEEAFLLEWDARNLKTIFRGIQSGLPEEDIINLIIPIGTLPLPYVNSLCASGGAEEVLGKLREDWANSIREYVGGGLEYTLAVDRWLVGIWKDLPYDFVKIRIDVLNIEIIARCQLSDIDASPFILEGGKFLDAKRLHQMVAAEDERAMFGMLARTPFEDISEAKSIKRFLHDIELKLLKDSSLSKPFSVEAAVSYLRAKEVEINNIMTILISKVQPVENIRGVLVYL